MKDLGMSWPDIKATPRIELEGLMAAYSEYTEVHSFDGYTSEDISEMAKTKPQVRSQYMQHMEAKARLDRKLGKKRQRARATEIKGLR
tara:strand:- start:546 stop:809 length:264 start_codon:yes stop_codon:yes gene_type:complete